MIGEPKASDVKVLGVSGEAIYIAVLNRLASKRGRYTLFRLCGTLAVRYGDEITLGHCRRLANGEGEQKWTESERRLTEFV